MAIKEQNHVEALRRLVESRGISDASRSSSSSSTEISLNEDSECLLVEQLKAYTLALTFSKPFCKTLRQNMTSGSC